MPADLFGGNDEKEARLTNTQSPAADDTQECITPHALNINPALIGLPLATPVKRLCALLLDGLALLLLSSLPGGFFLMVLAVAFLRYGKRSGARIAFLPPSSKKRVLAVLKPLFIVSLSLVLVLILAAVFLWVQYGEQIRRASNSVVFHGLDLSEEVPSGQVLGVNAFLLFAESSQGFSDCEDLACWQTELFYLSASLPDMGISKPSAEKVYEVFALATDLSDEQREQLVAYLLEHYGASMADHPAGKTGAIEAGDMANSYSLVSWLMIFLKDLGLGFSWTAFYFTLFTCVALGQTPGKKIMGVRVIKLDGTALSFWDSFFRYGGYAAGITTGLLGFLQIYWDPNRQAIQDKISSTVVVDCKKPSLDTRTAERLGP